MLIKEPVFRITFPIYNWCPDIRERRKNEVRAKSRENTAPSVGIKPVQIKPVNIGVLRLHVDRRDIKESALVNCSIVITVNS